MPIDRSDEVMKTLITKLYKTVTGGDENIKIPRFKFVSWLLPGIPFTTEDFEYCKTGVIVPVPRTETEKIDAANKAKLLYHQGWVLSKLFDFIPDLPDSGWNQFVNSEKLQQTIFFSTQDTISSVWNDVLRYSRVLHRKLGEEEEKRIQKLRDKLSRVVEYTDPVTDEKKTRPEPTPLKRAYDIKYQEYHDEANRYASLLADAIAAQGNDPEAIRRVHEFATKAKYYKENLNRKYAEFVADGYKNEVESIQAYIAEVTDKSLVLYKKALKEKLEHSKTSSVALGAPLEFYITTLIPGAFAENPSWPEFTFSHIDSDYNYSAEQSSWGGGGGLNFGFFSIGGSASSESRKYISESKLTSFRAKMDFTTIPIFRPWIEPGFFSMRSWILDDTWYLSYENKQVSDGAERPNGRLIAYPIMALFVRNVELRFEQSEGMNKAMQESVSGGGSIGFGIFSVGGSYSQADQKRESHWEYQDGAIKMTGIQLIGFLNNLVPKAPNPNPSLKPEDFVGGETPE